MDALNSDFAQFGGKYFIVAADQCSGFVMAAAMPNQSTDSALQFIHTIGLNYGYPTEVRSDKFSKEFEKYCIFHKTSDWYVPSSNGAAERAAQSVKSYLSKLGSLQPNHLQALLYRLNNTPSVIPWASSAFIRFFGQAGRIPDLPTLKQKISPAAIRIHRVKREEAQNAVAISKKRSDPTIFKVGDAVRI